VRNGARGLIEINYFVFREGVSILKIVLTLNSDLKGYG